MKLKTNINRYEASNVTLDINGTDIRAISYKWWLFVTVDSVGNIFFNDFCYSTSTSKHQRNVSDILKRLSIIPNFTIYSKTGLRNIKSCIESEICSQRNIIRIMIAQIKSKGSWSSVNERRRQNIKKSWYRIKDLRRIRDHYLNRKIIPLPVNAWTNKETSRYAKFFVKPNGKINIHDLRQVRAQWEPPYKINRIIELLGLKQSDSIIPILNYRYADDLNRMIPYHDTKERVLMMQWLKRQGISRQNYSSFDLDKMHTYLVNRENKKDYKPSQPIALQHNDTLEWLDKINEKFQWLKTDQELKAEGRRQNHCIGRRDTGYINLCLNKGYHAINYKGFTFFLNPDLSINQTSGRYNISTPFDIQSDLEQLIKAVKK